MSVKTVELGDRVKDRVTGFEGIVTAITDYLARRRQCEVAPTTCVDGKFEDARWFENDRLEVLQKGAVILKRRDRDGVE